MANGLISCGLAVRRVRSERGVVTLRNERRRRSFNTDTAAPVSISARAATPSTVTSLTLAGERGGLRNFDGAAVLASGTAAVSFPQRSDSGGDAWETANGDAEKRSDGWKRADGRQRTNSVPDPSLHGCSTIAIHKEALDGRR